jgi:hypothetical protein
MLMSVVSVGCANFDTVCAFAKDGATVAKKDLDIFLTSCAELKAEEAVLTYAPGKASVTTGQSQTCEAVISDQSIGRVDVDSTPVHVPRTLNALAGEENWALTKVRNAVGSQRRR